LIPIKPVVIVVLPFNHLLGNVSPQWCSVNNGIFLCFNCSGVHRALGMQISFIKSMTMDSWTDQQLNMMKEGGNAKFKAFMETYNLNQESPAMKYKTKAAEYYRKSVDYKLIL
jgi:ADP-ribosylation factor GTPase-activating protein 1